MTLSKNTLSAIQEFLLEFATKKFIDEEITSWAMFNLPNYSKDTFYFFKRTLKQFYMSSSYGTFLINHEMVNDVWKNNPEFLKKFNELIKKVK